MVVCTKLVQWLAFGAIFMEVWYGLLSGWFPVTLSPQLYEVLVPVSTELPIIINYNNHL